MLGGIDILSRLRVRSGDYGSEKGVNEFGEMMEKKILEVVPADTLIDEFQESDSVAALGNRALKRQLLVREPGESPPSRWDGLV